MLPQAHSRCHAAHREDHATSRLSEIIRSSMLQEAVQSNNLPPEPAVDRRPPGFWRRMVRNRTGFASLIVVVLILLATTFGPWLYRVDPAHTEFGAINAGP